MEAEQGDQRRVRDDQDRQLLIIRSPWSQPDRQPRTADSSASMSSTDPFAAPGSPDSSRSASPPLQLDPSTLAVLSSFYDEQAEADRQFQELEKKAHERLVAAQEGQAAGAFCSRSCA